MKRGVEILISWLVIAILLDTFVVPNFLFSHFGIFCDRLTVATFPLASWLYARHSDKVSAVICYGLIAGTFSIFIPLSFFYDAQGMARDITVGWKLAIIGVPVLMALLCVGVFALRLFLDGKDGHK